MSQEEKEEFTVLCIQAGQKAATRFRTVTRCFLNVNRMNGLMGRQALRDLFFTFHMPVHIADRFFDLLDRDRTGWIEYWDVTQIIGQHIQPGHRLPDRVGPAWHKVTAQNYEDEHNQAALHQLCEVIGAKAHQKHRNVRSCFRWVDDDKDGLVSRTEFLRFVKLYGTQESVAHHIFGLLAARSGIPDAIDYNTFLGQFGPYIQPGYTESAPVAPGPIPAPKATIAPAWSPSSQGSSAGSESKMVPPSPLPQHAVPGEQGKGFHRYAGSGGSSTASGGSASSFGRRGSEASNDGYDTWLERRPRESFGHQNVVASPREEADVRAAPPRSPSGALTPRPPSRPPAPGRSRPGKEAFTRPPTRASPDAELAAADAQKQLARDGSGLPMTDDEESIELDAFHEKPPPTPRLASHVPRPKSAGRMQSQPMSYLDVRSDTESLVSAMAKNWSVL